MSIEARMEAAFAALSQGRLIIVADSEDRENEGDFVGAAESVTAESVHFMISEGRGQLCLPMVRDVAERLKLTPMVPQTNLTTPCFTVPIDHELCRTGISPVERAFTIRKIADATSTAAEFIRPGHVFPLIARPGGVLERPGHTEATIDLLRLAGLQGVGMLCEICSGDGKGMATGLELKEIASRFDLPLVTIDDVIDFRRQHASNWSRALSAVAPR